jgi:prepilin-type N-terminal cleavage/methylation domain-containing protein
MSAPVLSHRASDRGFTLVEMIVVTFLLLVAMLGLLAVFDASARINKSETDVADAQGAVRYGIYQMTRVIRMAGSGGLYVTQAVLNARDPGMTGITLGGGANSYNNVPAGSTVTNTNGTAVEVREGTDMIEIRGVILSPLLGFDQQGTTGCSAGCATSADAISVLPITGDLTIGQLVNDDTSQRPQFQAIDAYTETITGAANSMLVIMSDGNTDLHVGCSDVNPQGVQRYPQPLYNVGRLSVAGGTDLSTVATPRVFASSVDFTANMAEQINAELPSDGPLIATPIGKPRRVGILDDIIFFIAMLPVADDPDGLHPYLAQGVRRGDRFEITPLAEDVEDLQIAYGVDGSQGVASDEAVTRVTATSQYDSDPNYSNQANGDEWRPNVQPAGTETPFTDIEFQSAAAPLGQHTGIPPSAHCPRLHAVMVSLLAKARDQDPTYNGPAASGYILMDVPLSGSSPVTAVQGKYRRRVQTLRINLRNYAFQG